ncbi:MAG: Inactive of metal-dependent protease, putative molecular chaperone [Chlorobi bacterium]|nr:Inactive of metal-dependent protease, putative molecular chaperone [Chlorobiota bacterium]
MLVAIETTGDTCGVALFDGNTLRGELHVEMPRSHDRLLAHLFQQLLEATEVTPREIKSFAVSVGPGSYTGIRIGMSFAIGASLATGAAIIPVPTLDAIAFDVRYLGNVSHRSRVISLISAGRGGLYAGLYEITPEFNRLTETKTIPASQIPPLLDENVFAAGPGASLIDASCSDNIAVDSERLTAAAIGRLGLYLSYRGVGSTAEDIRPLYISDYTPVLTPKKGKKGGR